MSTPASVSTTAPTNAALQRASIVAVIAAMLFFVHISLYFTPFVSVLHDTVRTIYYIELDALLGVIEHLMLFPVIAALPAPQWAKQAGYGWLVIDMATNIMQLGGVPAALPLRYGGHIAAAVWAAAASWQARGALRVVGVIYAIDLALYSFIWPFSRLSFLVLLPSLVLLPVWLLLVAGEIRRMRGQLVS